MLTALLATALVQAAPAPAVSAVPEVIPVAHMTLLQRPPVFAPRAIEGGSACKSPGTVQADWDPAIARRDRRTTVKPLAAMPKPDEEKAVLRMIGPCVAPAVVAYSVGR